MADNATKTKPKPFTPVGQLSFPHLFVPRAATPGAEERFSVTVLFDKEAQKSPEYKKMQQAVLEVAKAKWPGKDVVEMFKTGKLRSPFHDASEKSEFNGYTEGKVFISAWSKQRPGVVDRKVNPVLAADVFPGVLGRISYNPFAYDTGGNRGVSLGLNNVQIVSFDSERLDSRKSAEDEFDELDAGEYGGDEDDAFGGENQTSGSMMDEDDEIPF